MMEWFESNGFYHRGNDCRFIAKKSLVACASIVCITLWDHESHHSPHARGWFAQLTNGDEHSIATEDVELIKAAIKEAKAKKTQKEKKSLLKRTLP